MYIATNKKKHSGKHCRNKTARMRAKLRRKNTRRKLRVTRGRKW